MWHAGASADARLTTTATRPPGHTCRCHHRCRPGGHVGVLHRRPVHERVVPRPHDVRRAGPAVGSVAGPVSGRVSVAPGLQPGDAAHGVVQHGQILAAAVARTGARRRQATGRGRRNHQCRGLSTHRCRHRPTLTGGQGQQHNRRGHAVSGRLHVLPLATAHARARVGLQRRPLPRVPVLRAAVPRWSHHHLQCVGLPSESLADAKRGGAVRALISPLACPRVATSPQVRVPQRSVSRLGVVRYAVRWLVAACALEVWLHYFPVYAAGRASLFRVNRWPPYMLLTFAWLMVNALWLKFLVRRHAPRSTPA